MPAPVGGIQQQHSLVIYIGETAVQGGGFETNLDRLAEPARPRSPSQAHWGETLRPPASRPWVEMPDKRFRRRCRRGRAVAFPGDGRRRKLGIDRRRDEVDPDADDDKRRVPTVADLRLEEDTGDLAAANQHVVWPF